MLALPEISLQKGQPCQQHVQKGTTENILMIGDYGRFSQNYLFSRKDIAMESFPKICVKKEQMAAAA
jgi:hypothetical protein